MFREHAPLIAVTTVLSILLYLAFRDLRNLHAGVDALAAQMQLPLVAEPDQVSVAPALTQPATPEPAAEPATKAAAKRA